MTLSPQVKSSLLTAIFTVIFFFICNAIFTYFTIPFISSVSNTKTPFTAQGTGTATAKPDKAQVSFTVSKTVASLQDAQNQANTSTNIIVSDIEKIGITKSDIQTSNYSSYPNYNNINTGTPEKSFIINPQSNNQTITSYTVQENVTVSITDDSKINMVIDTITKDNAENISGPNYVFSDATQKSLQNQARTLAINDAKQKAQSIATAAGIHLGRITNVQENTGGYPMQPVMMDSKAAVSGSAPTQINPGENTVTSSVTITYQTY